MTSFPIKSLAAAVAAAALIASPALARTAQTKASATHAQERAAAPYQNGWVGAPFQGSYAAADRAPAFAPGAVIAADGRVVGADPDPNVRQELSRDAWVSAY